MRGAKDKVQGWGLKIVQSAGSVEYARWISAEGSDCCIVICWFMQKYTYIYWIHTDAMIKTQEDFSTKYMYLSLYCKISKRVTQGLRVRGTWRPNRKCNILTPTLMAVNVVSFSFSRCSTGGPEAHSAGWWLSLLHLISNFPGPQLIRAPRPLRPDVAFLTTSRL